MLERFSIEELPKQALGIEAYNWFTEKRSSENPLAKSTFFMGGVVFGGVEFLAPSLSRIGLRRFLDERSSLRVVGKNASIDKALSFVMLGSLLDTLNLELAVGFAIISDPQTVKDQLVGMLVGKILANVITHAGINIAKDFTS